MLGGARRFVGRHLDGALLSVLLLLAAGVVLPRLSFHEASAEDATVEKWKTVALSDVALNLRMMALEQLKRDGSTGALDALEAIAKAGDLPVRTAACAQLGRVKSSASKGKLKGLLEDSGLRTEVRMAAAACIAEHWKDEGDLTYLESMCSGDSRMSDHYGVIRSKVYGK